jgi:hypothetical protein
MMISKDNGDLIHVVCARDRDHLQYVRLEFRNLFGRHLLHDIEKETSFFFKDTVTGNKKERLCYFGFGFEKRQTRSCDEVNGRRKKKRREKRSFHHLSAR